MITWKYENLFCFLYIGLDWNNYLLNESDKWQIVTLIIYLKKNVIMYSMSNFYYCINHIDLYNSINKREENTSDTMGLLIW